MSTVVASRKRLSSIIVGVVLAFAATPAAALAITQKAHSGAVSATFTFHGSLRHGFSGLRLLIRRSDRVVYDKPIVSGSSISGGCGKYCQPAGAFPRSQGGHPSVHVLHLARAGEPDVVLDVFSGGAHCCTIEQVFRYDATTRTYLVAERNFGDFGDRIKDLGHNGRFEFLSADDRFAYAFTDFAASGLPIQILIFRAGRFIDVTRHYRSLIAKDAAMWLNDFKRNLSDGVGLIGAWAADEDLLGHNALVKRTLAVELRRGNLHSALVGGGGSGRKFLSKLNRFLRKYGYLH